MYAHICIYPYMQPAPAKHASCQILRIKIIIFEEGNLIFQLVSVDNKLTIWWGS